MVKNPYRHMGFPHLIRQFMLLNCPACATRYTLDEAQLGPAGRTVRCAACKTTWFAEKPASDPIDLSLSKPAPDRIEDLQAVSAEKLPLQYRAMVEDKKRMQALATQGIIWGSVAAAMIAVLALAFFLRVSLVTAFPRVAGAYAMVGLPTYGTSLQFGANTADNNVKGGRFLVTVKAQIKNTSGKPAPVPPVRVRLLDKTLQQFNSVLMPSNGLVVPPHATRTLLFDIPDPENMTSTVDLQFDLEAMKSAHGKPAVRQVAQAPEPTPAPASEADAIADNGADAGAPADTDAGPDVADTPTPSLRQPMPSGGAQPAAPEADAAPVPPAASPIRTKPQHS